MFKSYKLLVLFVSIFLFVPTVYADPWTETATTIYTTDVSKNVGIGTTTPGYEIHGISSQGAADPFVFEGYDGAYGERDIFTITTNDLGGASQDESSLLKVWQKRSWDNAMDAATLVELSYGNTLPTSGDRHFYILGRTNSEGAVSWGISLLDSDFWTVGSITGGATGTDCGGTNAACFSGGSFHFGASGDSYINGGNVGIGTTSPDTLLDLNADSEQYPFYISNTSSSVGLQLRPSGIATGYILSDDTGKLTLEGFSGSSGTIMLRTGNSDSMFIDAGGNVGIGTASPELKLVVDGSDTSNWTEQVLNTDSDVRLAYPGGYGIFVNATGTATNAYLLSLNDDSTNRFIVKKDGNVGIGTTIPEGKLDVRASGGNSTLLTSYGANEDTYLRGGTFGSTIYLGDNFANDVILASGGGSVGIGTTSPSAKLDIQKTLGSGIALNVDNDFGSGVTGSYIGSYINASYGTLSTGDLTGLQVNVDNDGIGHSYVAVFTGGNVGIGTISPTQALDVNGRINLPLSSDGNTPALIFGNGTGIGYGATSTSLVMTTNGTERVRIDAYGNVGIGTSSPTQALDVNGRINLPLSSDGNTPSLIFGNGAGIGYGATSSSLVMTTSGTERVRIDANGNVGIGTTSPTQALDVNGNIVASGTICDSTGCIGSGGGSSYWSTGTAGIYYSSGNVGIGTSSPSAKLEVYGGGDILLKDDGTDPGDLVFQNSSGTEYGRVYSWSDSTLRLSGGSNTDPEMYITDSGVGIGTSSPSATLDVAGDVNIDDVFTIGGVSSPDIVYPDPSLSDHADSSVEGTIAYYLDQMESTGGSIYLRPGTYTILSQLPVPSDVSIIGSGKNSIIKASNSYSDGDPLIINIGGGGGNGEDVNDVLFQDFTLDGNYDVNSAEVDCMQISVGGTHAGDYAEHITVDGLTVQNCGRNGLDLGQIHDLVLSDLYLSNNGYYDVDGSYPDHNIYLSDSDYVRINNITSTDAKSDGLKIQDSYDVTVSNSVFYENNGRGVFIGGNSEDIILNGLVIRDNGGSYTEQTDGIQIVDTVSKVDIQGCIIEDITGGSGIYIRVTIGSSSGYNFSIGDNIIRNNDDDGIFLNTGQHITISGNTIISNGSYGIRKTSTTEETVVGNTILHNTSGAYTGSMDYYSSNNDS